MNRRLAIRRMLLLCKGGLPSGIIPPVRPAETIARTVHQTFPPRPMPEEIRQNIAHIQRINPDWTYRLYDDEAMTEFIRVNYGPRVLDYFLRINPLYGAARADLFRYLLLYKVGGVYLDIKSTLTRPLSEVIQPTDRYLLSHWRNRPGEEFERWGIYPELAASPNGEFQQWHIVAAAGHPFLRAVIESVLKNIVCYSPALDGVGWSGVLRATGPIAYTLAIMPEQRRHAHRIVDSLRELGFQYSIYPRSTAHQALFSSHYSAKAEPIVKLGAADAVLSGVLAGLQSVRGRLRAHSP